MRGKWFAKRMLNRIMPQAAILLYHRVANEALDPQLLCVSPKHFDEHLQVLRKRYRPTTLKTLAARYRFGMAPDRAAVVTFDDGYADNMLEASPILDRNDVPATVFVAAGFVKQASEYWWDTLQRVFLVENVLPREFVLNLGGTVYTRSLGDVTDYDSVKARNYSGWTVLSRKTPTMRHEIYSFLGKTLKGMGWEQQQQVLGDVRQWAGSALKDISPPPVAAPDKAWTDNVTALPKDCHRLPAAATVIQQNRSNPRAMTPAEVIKLDQIGIVEIGAHTVNHSMLSALSPSDQKSEIIQGKRMLEDMLEREVETFAYPYGDRTDYTLETVRLVREAGFACACSNFEGHTYPWTDRFQLPRFLVRNWDGDEFERRLDEFIL